jgi:hypothetical protein
VIRTRDEVCRTPWCGAPIRHADHVVPAHAAGATSAANGQGLCERCNQVKEAPGWWARPGPRASVLLGTPTGHQYESRAPSPPVESEHDGWAMQDVPKVTHAGSEVGDASADAASTLEKVMHRLVRPIRSPLRVVVDLVDAA